MAEISLEGVRVLVTGAGGPAAVAFMQSVGRAGAEIWAVDIDPYAAGLYLVDSAHRALVPRGDDPRFVDSVAGLCERDRIDVLVPTVDTELIPVARRAEVFEAHGTTVLGQTLDTLECCLDKWTLVQRVAAAAPDAPVACTVLVDDELDTQSWSFPFIAKPRRGSGSRGVTLVNDSAELARVPHDGSFIAQELLPGREHSLDVLAYRDGVVAAVVPRTRLKVDSGIAVAGAVEPDPDLIAYGKRIAEAVGLTSVGNVQVKQNRDGLPRLLEVNPRFPGSMPLTVAAGVDMPVLAVADALGRTVPAFVEFSALAMVRTWTETYFDPSEMMS
jgi:carbamoyl-phosphate synthase large subunit